MFESTLEVVVLEVEKVNDAFQLFDSQNTRGKILDPHDLLKAYHLREMKEEPYEMFHTVTRWESFMPLKIRKIYNNNLYPILNWVNKEKTKEFTANEIDTYKGINKSSNYTYAKRALKVSPYFQINEPFISGEDFFNFTEHYLIMSEDIKDQVVSKECFKQIKEIIDSNKSTGFRYTIDLFYCVLLYYYDRFYNFDEQVIKKLFTWAFMIRVDMDHLSFDTINKYAIGEENEHYSNHIAIFFLISKARHHKEIANLLLNVKREPDKAFHNNWNDLYIKLKEMNEVK